MKTNTQLVDNSRTWLYFGPSLPLSVQRRTSPSPLHFPPAPGDEGIELVGQHGVAEHHVADSMCPYKRMRWGRGEMY